ncbi:heme NO-binding domain-containing protein [uncultured Aquitalea sp.]|uniref:heme NO-binding domain-containing protein n=1 Tax=uncultured Aquitalea sp. TaxID=540272 RepID=UPI0025D7FFC1|nr:heme NO-binding domain-containing protein [uncultured Aquitalea sp.]
MKGVVFTEFLDMVESRFSANMVDDIIDDADLASGGAYTSVGTYPFQEMAALVGALSRASGQPAGALIHAFGYYLFGRFAQVYPDSLVGKDNTFSLLCCIENSIHVEVLKLYPEAELPRFAVESMDDTTLVLRYDSPRCLGELAKGLIQGALDHYHECGVIREEALKADGSSMRFTVELT